MLAILQVWGDNFIVVVTWISLTSDVGHIFMYLLAICMASLEKGLISSSHLKRQGFFFCCWILWVCYIFLILTPYQIWLVNILSHPTGCFFILVFFPVQKFNVVPLIFILLLDMISCLAMETNVKIYPYIFFQEFCRFRSYM